MSRVVFSAVVLVIAGSGGCNSPALPSGHFSCGEADCPPGMVCAGDGLCYMTPPRDGGEDLTDGAPGDLDACTAETDQELCEAHTVACGALAVSDSCGTARGIAECGPCADTHYCSASSCVPCVFSWHTGSWGSCSAECDGGTQTRDVWCECSGTTVSSSLCPAGSKPASSQSCNTEPCCSCPAHDGCGDDGCGNSCGTCTGERWCGWGTYCITSLISDGSTSCDTVCAGSGSVCLGVCFWSGSDCIDPASYSCATVGVNGLYCYCW